VLGPSLVPGPSLVAGPSSSTPPSAGSRDREGTFFDALRVKIRDEALVRSQAVYLALAVMPDDHRDILGLWIEPTERAKFWMKVFSDLKPSAARTS
jgi:transposase-like protein